MRSFLKGKAPAEVHEHAEAWQREYEHDPSLLESSKRARTRFDQLKKSSAQTALHREQSGLCAFCLAKIRPTSPVLDVTGTVLAHVVPIECDKRTIFDWDNLVGSCTGGAGTASHCDRSQGNRTLFINPSQVHAIEQHIRYSPRGNLRYRGPALCGRTAEQIQAEFDEVLGLNIERLRANRRAIIEVAHRAMEALGWSRANLQREILRWSTPDKHGCHKPYFSVAVAYLQRKLPAQP